MTVAPRMDPAPSTQLLRFVGDRLRVTLAAEDAPEDAQAFLRTNLTRAREARLEVIAASGTRPEEALTFAGASWRDIPLTREGSTWIIDLPLLEVGHFRAKAYWVDASRRQHWPDGEDLNLSVHPNALRTSNTLYCAFPRAMGEKKRPASLFGSRADADPSGAESALALSRLDALGYTVIPPSGTLRQLTRALPHIFEDLGCRILHLLPIGPVPTTYARMGRFGSPYAQLDLTAIDAALVEFDKKTTAVDQFHELTDGVHARDGLVILDIVLNHTGWGSVLMDAHPEWFRRNADGTFHSPGAWGNTWADLVELELTKPSLWNVLADSLLVWCRRGVDGFRCDAGYMVPLPAWQYIVARVRDEFPECIFLLEGLGGAWEATASLLSHGGMQWAYSELFQCYEPTAVAHYLDHALAQGERIGVLAHYSETHDNDRLAKRGATWSRMRNALSALSSQNGAFGFTSGVEWLCTQKIDVHEARPLAWGNPNNLVSDLKRLNGLLAEHPCFFDGAKVRRVSPDDSPVLVLSRTSRDAEDHCLILINLDSEQAHTALLTEETWALGGSGACELLGQAIPVYEVTAQGVEVSVQAGQALCLSAHRESRGASGELYRTRRSQAAWAYAQLGALFPHESLGEVPFLELAAFVAEDPERFLAASFALSEQGCRTDLLAALREARTKLGYRAVVRITESDVHRITLVPPQHWVLVTDAQPFEIAVEEQGRTQHLRSIPTARGHVAALPPMAHEEERDLRLHFDRFGDDSPIPEVRLRRLSENPAVFPPSRAGLVLLTNGRGAMLRMHADFGAVHSKYDCVLAANLHAEVPSERWVLVKRVRAWVNADGFVTALDAQNLTEIAYAERAAWSFAANAGAGRRVGVRITAQFVPGLNRVQFTLSRMPLSVGEQEPDVPVRVTLRFDLEDRSMHAETQLGAASEAHFVASSSPLAEAAGFLFSPAPERTLRVTASAGSFHPDHETSFGVFHRVEANRGLPAYGDAFSPGWFDLPLECGEEVSVCVDAEPNVAPSTRGEELACAQQVEARGQGAASDFESTLRHAAQAFVVRRGAGKTVVAGYPWFLDWGRDTLIAARGLLAAGYVEAVTEILLTFADLERDGTLPNYLAGAGEGSRESSDAPLWFALACEELARLQGSAVYALCTQHGRTLGEVLLSIADGYLKGTPHGVRVDAVSGLVFSPPHFTWMDTNYPAATPREGYPIELGVLFASLLRQVAQIEVSRRAFFEDMLARTTSSIAGFFDAELGYCADTLHARAFTPAAQAEPDDHLRPNQLLAVTLGFLEGEAAQSVVRAVERHLLIPGALRSLAPLQVRRELPVHDDAGTPLNDPRNPYWGRYEGDEDTRRKPAYHNGTAWNWWMPLYCEALVVAYPGDARTHAAARAVLGSAASLLSQDALGHLPEVMDGDAPHHARGCDAQAWSVTEALRVWRKLCA